MVRPPSYEDIARAADAAPTGVAPPPAENVPPSADAVQPTLMSPGAEQVPQQTVPRTAVKAWPVEGAAAAAPGAGPGAGAGVEEAGAARADFKDVAVAPPTPALMKVSRASPMRPQGKGTPARRGRTKKSATPAVPAVPTVPSTTTTKTSGAGGGGGGGNVGRSQAEQAPAATRSSPLPVGTEPAQASAEPPRSPGRPTTGALARRMLDIEIVEAAGLLGTEKGGVSNPRADILLVDLGGRAIRSEGVKHTAVVKGTTNPVWNYKVSFGQRANLSAPAGGNMPTLRVQVCVRVARGPGVRHSMRYVSREAPLLTLGVSTTVCIPPSRVIEQEGVGHLPFLFELLPYCCSICLLGR